jgi:hypothetical protein
MRVAKSKRKVLNRRNNAMFRNVTKSLDEFRFIKAFAFMPRAGLEPARSVAPTDFKSVASTNSATPAERQAV